MSVSTVTLHSLFFWLYLYQMHLHSGAWVVSSCACAEHFDCATGVKELLIPGNQLLAQTTVSSCFLLCVQTWMVFIQHFNVIRVKNQDRNASLYALRNLLSGVGSSSLVHMSHSSWLLQKFWLLYVKNWHCLLLETVPWTSRITSSIQSDDSRAFSHKFLNNS